VPDKIYAGMLDELEGRDIEKLPVRKWHCCCRMAKGSGRRGSGPILSEIPTAPTSRQQRRSLDVQHCMCDGPRVLVALLAMCGVRRALMA
jgi:hypothetical protein